MTADRRGADDARVHWLRPTRHGDRSGSISRNQPTLWFPPAIVEDALSGLRCAAHRRDRAPGKELQLVLGSGGEGMHSWGCIGTMVRLVRIPRGLERIRTMSTIVPVAVPRRSGPQAPGDGPVRRPQTVRNAARRALDCGSDEKAKAEAEARAAVELRCNRRPTQRPRDADADRGKVALGNDSGDSGDSGEGGVRWLMGWSRLALVGERGSALPFVFTRPDLHAPPTQPLHVSAPRHRPRLSAPNAVRHRDDAT